MNSVTYLKLTLKHIPPFSVGDCIHSIWWTQAGFLTFSEPLWYLCSFYCGFIILINCVIDQFWHSGNLMITQQSAHHHCIRDHIKSDNDASSYWSPHLITGLWLAELVLQCGDIPLFLPRLLSPLWGCQQCQWGVIVSLADREICADHIAWSTVVIGKTRR